MSITRETVLELQALERDTVPLPWHVGPYYKCDVHANASRPDYSYIVKGSSVCPADTRDAKFIVESRNALPALITTCLSMAERIAAVEAVLAEYDKRPSESEDDFIKQVCECLRAVRAALAGEG